MTTSAPIALVTGGSRGLGRSTVLALAKRGVHSIFTYNSNRSEAEKITALAREAGAQAIALQLDTGNVPAFEDFIGRVRQALARLGAEGRGQSEVTYLDRERLRPCGGSLQGLGQPDESEVVEAKTVTFTVTRHVRPKKRCARCRTIVQAAAPSRPIAKSFAGAATRTGLDPLGTKFCTVRNCSGCSVTGDDAQYPPAAQDGPSPIRFCLPSDRVVAGTLGKHLLGYSAERQQRYPECKTPHYAKGPFGFQVPGFLSSAGPGLRTSQWTGFPASLQVSWRSCRFLKNRT